MVQLSNKRVLLVKRPSGSPALEHFKTETQIIDTATLQDGEIIAKTNYTSLEPYQYMIMGRPETPDVVKERPFLNRPISLGDVFGGMSVGVIVASKHEKYQIGDIVQGHWGWQEYARFSPDDNSNFNFEKVGNEYFGKDGVPLSLSIGIFRVSGPHAVYGFDYLQLKKGQTIAISAAGGNIGIIVGQYAKLKGIRVVGIAGGAEKCEKLKQDLGYDSVVDYRQAGDDVQKLTELIRQTAPEGIDGYFDNVGGIVTEAVNANLKENSCVYMCGNISQYTAGKSVEIGAKSEELYNKKNITASTCFIEKYLSNEANAKSELFDLIKQNKFKAVEWIREGIENAPQAFIDMYQGKNYGKAIVKVADEEFE